MQDDYSGPSSAKSSKRSAIARLNIAYNDIGPDGVAGLMQALMNNPLTNVRSVNVACTGIGAPALPGIVPLVVQNTRLIEVILDGNLLGPEGLWVVVVARAVYIGCL